MKIGIGEGLHFIELEIELVGFLTREHVNEIQFILEVLNLFLLMCKIYFLFKLTILGR